MTRWPGYLSPGWLAAYALGALLWCAIDDLVGWWWIFGVVAGLYLLLIAWVASVGGVAAAVRVLEARSADAPPEELR